MTKEKTEEDIINKEHINVMKEKLVATLFPITREGERSIIFLKKLASFPLFCNPFSPKYPAGPPKRVDKSIRLMC